MMEKYFTDKGLGGTEGWLRSFEPMKQFFIRKGWLSKGMRYVSQKPDVFTNRDDNPMDVLGIGANMVKSLRYWLQAVGLTKEPKTGKKNQSLTPFGNIVHEKDPYTEELGTLYLLHYKLVTDEEMAPSWYYFFNKFAMKEFSKDDFVAQIQNELKMDGTAVAIRSLTYDLLALLIHMCQGISLIQTRFLQRIILIVHLENLGLLIS